MVENSANLYLVSMFRFTEFMIQSFKQRDWFALLLLTFVLGIAGWIVSMPFSATTREHAIRRFHVASPSFPVWAAMGPVPSMYNFENRAQFTNELIGDGPFNEEHKSWFSSQLNHFPARILTFGDSTARYFREIQEQPDGSMHIQRLEENWVQHDAKK
jgi:hypothetical protein